MNIDKYIPNLPIKLGDARRTPSYSWDFWNISYTKEAVMEGDEAYRIEWESGTQNQIIYVAEAAKLAGLGDANQELRNTVVKIFRYLAKKREGEIIYLEPGAGASTEKIFEELESDGFDLDRIKAILLEPSKSRIDNLSENLHKRFGLIKGKNFIAESARDYDAPRYIKNNKVDFVVYVATLHHHPDRRVALRLIKDVMENDGIIIIGDWFNSMWEHPAKVYSLLSKIDWETKDEDLRKFLEIFPNCYGGVFEEDIKIEKSNEQISKFWTSWARVRDNAIKNGEFSENDEIYMLEAHTPIHRLERDLDESGFDIKSREIRELIDEGIEIYCKEDWNVHIRKITDNPFSLYQDSELLSIIVGQKKNR